MRSIGNTNISADGRFVAFDTDTTNLVANDTNDVSDVFVCDREQGTTERVSVGSGGRQGNGKSSFPKLSADGRFVAFDSEAANLVQGDTNGTGDVFVRDRKLDTTERVSLRAGGRQANGGGGAPSISADGRFVAFGSNATNLVQGDTNDTVDVFVRDRQQDKTERISLGSGERQTDRDSFNPGISANGRFVAYTSEATNLVQGDTNGVQDVFVRDRRLDTTERVSVGPGERQANGDSFAYLGLSANGRSIAFFSRATNLVPGDTNGTTDVFVRDR